MGSEFLPFLLEIGTEEIPSNLLVRGLEGLKAAFIKEAEAGNLPVRGVQVMGTPRRMALLAEVAPRQTDQSRVVIGPPARVAWDGDGNLTKAATGFARSQGVDPDQLQAMETPRGQYAGVHLEQPGKGAKQVLGPMLERCITGISWGKSMRWGDQDVTFIRPVHWIVALLDDQVVPVRFGNIQSGNQTRGHRFLHPDQVMIPGPSRYVELMESLGVIVSLDRRRDRIVAQLDQLTRSVNGRGVDGEPGSQVMEANVCLTEFPICCLGSFSTEYLALPREVIVSAMENHQRYFPVEDGETGKLLPAFVAVNNTPSKDPAVVRSGHERVLRARLSDATFFWQEDLKKSFTGRTQELEQIIFLRKLNRPTMLDKAKRVQAIAGELAALLAPQAAESAKEAALLSKNDLATLMVGEFPDLQGTMGKYYALQDQVDPDVAQAIEGHYRPRGAADSPPDHTVSCLVGLADRMDTIASCFTAGLIPTGTADPYALRRAALGIIRTVLHSGYHLSLKWMVDLACTQVEAPESVAPSVYDFIMARLRAHLTEELPGDGVDAVLATGEADLINIKNKVTLLTRFQGTDGFADLLAGVKRAGNISKDHQGAAINKGLLKEPAEIALARALDTAEAEIDGALENRDYGQALEILARLRLPIDSFFDQVLVMDQDEQVKANRLNLCKGVYSLFQKFAHFSLIRG